jgi:hypothetical protein
MTTSAFGALLILLLVAKGLGVLRHLLYNLVALQLESRTLGWVQEIV